MIEQKSSTSVPLNSYNVAQLQFSLEDPKGDSTPFVDDSPLASPAIMITPETDVDYSSRRMSSSATSTADTDSSAVSRSEKRVLTPSDSPQTKNPRTSGEHQTTWDSDSSPTTNGGNNKSTLDAGLEHTKVQLPSIYTTFEDSFRGDLRRASLPNLHSDNSTTRVRHSPYPPTGGRANYAPINTASLSSYQFPPNSDAGSYNDSPYPNSAISNGATPSTSTFPSGTSSTFSSPLSSSEYRSAGLSPNSYAENEHWHPSSTNIARPNSTPGQVSGSPVKYEDGIRHSSFSAPLSQSQMFAGSTRISGQDRSRSFSAGVKADWCFPNSEFVLPSTSTPITSPVPPITVGSSPRSPQGPSSQLVDRPRKRGKLPKETTDFLKAWLHRHSDHPYPSEEEKKQLCHATGLSMSQVSNWMINARRRILAPAHRAASGPTTTAPFPPSTRSAGLLEPIGRRSSMPSDSLQLYHPMSLQSLPNGAHHSADYVGSTRHMLGLPPARPSYTGSGMDFTQSRLNFSYVNPGQGPHSAGSTPPGNFLTSNMPLSAPPTLAPNPFSQNNQSMYSQQQHGSQGFGTPRLPSQGSNGSEQSSATFYPDGQSQTSTSGQSSGYQTPQ